MVIQNNINGMTMNESAEKENKPAMANSAELSQRTEGNNTRTVKIAGTTAKISTGIVPNTKHDCRILFLGCYGV